MRQPTRFAALLILLAFATILTGIFEAVPVANQTEDLSIKSLDKIIYVIQATRFFKLFLPVTLAILMTLMGWALFCSVVSFFKYYIDNVYVIPEHISIGIFLLSIVMIGISVWRSRHALSDITKDRVFLIAETLFGVATSLGFGVSLGQAKARKEVARLENEKTEARNKILKLHLLISSLPGTHSIPPDLYP